MFGQGFRSSPPTVHFGDGLPIIAFVLLDKHRTWVLRSGSTATRLASHVVLHALVWTVRPSVLNSMCAARPLNGSPLRLLPNAIRRVGDFARLPFPDGNYKSFHKCEACNQSGQPQDVEDLFVNRLPGSLRLTGSARLCNSSLLIFATKQSVAQFVSSDSVVAQSLG